jgi:hypothetical protein
MHTNRTHKNESPYTGVCRSRSACSSEVHVSQVKRFCLVFMYITKNMCSSSKMNDHIASRYYIYPISS